MFKYIIGIDEVGRGPLAGPVTVAALALPQNLKFKIKNLKLPLRDSKKLSPKQREAWFGYIKESQKSKVKSQRLYYAVASVSPKVIDKINITKAANLAATRAFQKLVNSYAIASVLTKNNVNIKVFLDGGLYLKKLQTTNYPDGKTIEDPRQSRDKLKAKTITRGDEKIPAISLASIVAKVIRDGMMRELHKKYSKYGFDQHKGYGTKQHFKMIRKYGLSPIHRKSFKLKS